MVTKEEQEILREFRKFKRSPVARQQSEISKRESQLKGFIGKRTALKESQLDVAERQIKGLEKERRKLRRLKFQQAAGKELKTASKGFGRELRNLRRQVRAQPQQVPIQQPMQQIPRQELRPRKRGMVNFFAHRSDKEVFGDNELTLFDSNKAKRAGGFSTGGLFGF